MLLYARKALELYSSLDRTPGALPDKPQWRGQVTAKADRISSAYCVAICMHKIVALLFLEG